MDLSIIIVNWNSKEFLNQCLVSLTEQVCELSFEVIVIDNASFDGTGDLIQDQFPWVEFIQGDENVGVGGRAL
jgi:N-acetylglucosaminyl-diphospho-decaprenol L-rhamnosyltransferase